MLFSNFLADVNIDFFIYCGIVLTKLLLCIVTKIKRIQEFNFLIKTCHISWLAPYFFVHIYQFEQVGNH